MKKLIKNLTRRDLIKQFGLAGVMVLPVLRQSRSFANDFKPIYCQLFKPHGNSPGLFYPNGDDKNFNFNGKATESFNGLQEYLIVPKGLNMYVSGHANHQAGLASVFTNTLGSDINRPPPGASIDHMIAGYRKDFNDRKVKKHINFHAGTISSVSYNEIYESVSFLGNGNVNKPKNNMNEMIQELKNLLGQCGAMGPVSAPNPQIASKINILDFHLENIKNAKQSLNLSTAEKSKLDIYTDRLNETLSRTTPTVVNNTSCPEFPKEYPNTGSDYSEAKANAVMDLVVLAMEHELVDVASLMLGRPEDNHKFGHISAVGGDTSRWLHSISHYDKGQSDEILYDKIMAYLYGLSANFLRKLKDTKTIDGENLLDKHLVLFSGGEVSHGKKHNYNDIPLMLAGKCGGRITPGYTFTPPSSNNANAHGRLLLTVCHAMGMTNLSHVGDPKKAPGGPLIPVSNV